MRIRSLRTAAASCTLALAPVACYAQVGAPIVQPTQPARQIGQPSTPGTVVTPGQAIRNGNQTLTTPADGSPQLHASNATNQGDSSLQNYFITKMMLVNKAEVELGQLAQDRAQSDDVKQFAQMLIQEHQQMNQQLSQLQAGGQQTGAHAAGTQSNDGQGAPNSAGIREGADGKQAQGHKAKQAGSHDQVPQQLTMICQQAAAKQLDMSREMLGEHEGQDFDMGFLGLQIAKHAYALAELQSIKNVGSQDFQQLVSTAEQRTNQHLKEAKKLANKLKDNKSNQ